MSSKLKEQLTQARDAITQGDTSRALQNLNAVLKDLEDPHVYRSKPRRWMFLFYLVVIAAAAASIVFAVLRPSSAAVRIALGIAWGIGPPAYFFLETVCFFPRWGNRAREEELKKYQTLGARFWTGLGATIALIFVTYTRK